MTPTTTAKQMGIWTVANRGLSVAAGNRSSGSSPSQAGEVGGAQEPMPIWLAVLMATSCQARTKHGRHDVRWKCVSGRAVYTNFGGEPESIEPLGVNLSEGETLAVSWTPNETAYTVEVYSPTEKCA